MERLQFLDQDRTARHVALEQKIEDARTLSRKNMTISFFAKGI